MTELHTPVAIVGNGGAAAEAVLALRAGGYDGRIDLFADNAYPPYNPMLGPYFISGALPFEGCFPFGDAGDFYGANQLIAHLASPIVQLDPARRTLVTGEGAVASYDRCLIASGARQAVPPVPGLYDNPYVYGLRSATDGLRLKSAVNELLARQAGNGGGRGTASGTVAVIGASLAGVKVATLLADRGLEIWLLDKETHILPLAAHPDVAQPMEDHLEALGVRLGLGLTLEEVDRTEAGLVIQGSAAATGKRLRLPADLAIICTGARPSLDFLPAGSLHTGQGIMIDEQCRSSEPTVYAAGDVAEGRNLLTGRHEVIALWRNAREQGRTVGANMAIDLAPGDRGPAVRRRRLSGTVPHNITHVGRMVFAGIGNMKEYDRLEKRVEDGSIEMRAWLDGRLIGVNLLDCCQNAGVLTQAFVKSCVAGETGTQPGWEPAPDMALGRGPSVQILTGLVREVAWTSSNAC